MKKLLLITVTVLGLLTSTASADSCFISANGSMGCSSWGTSSTKGK
ncbi:hypothetical protein [Arcobacter sp. 15-2]